MPHDIATIRSAGGFSVIMADPAWRYKDTGSNGAAEDHYPTMSVDEICALPVEQIAAKDCALLLWATWPLLPDAMRVITSWGFEYKTLAFNWVKYTERLIPFFGMGHFTRGNTEPCFLAVRGKPKVLVHNVRQVIEDRYVEEAVLTAPNARHSEKPAAARERIESMFGDVLRVELFARETIPGWDSWGNEVDSPITFK